MHEWFTSTPKSHNNRAITWMLRSFRSQYASRLRAAFLPWINYTVRLPPFSSIWAEVVPHSNETFLRLWTVTCKNKPYIKLSYLLLNQKQVNMKPLISNSLNRELSTKEAALLLGLAPSTLRKWRCTKEQPDLLWIKRFRKIFYIESEVLAFKLANTHQSSQETYI